VELARLERELVRGLGPIAREVTCSPLLERAPRIFRTPRWSSTDQDRAGRSEQVGPSSKDGSSPRRATPPGGRLAGSSDPHAGVFVQRPITALRRAFFTRHRGAHVPARQREPSTAPRALVREERDRRLRPTGRVEPQARVREPRNSTRRSESRGRDRAACGGAA